MLRIPGIICIFTGCIGLGLFYKRQYHKATNLLYLMIEIVDLFISEIAYGKATLHECLKEVEKKTKPPFQEAFAIMQSRLKEETDSSFPAVWEEEMKKVLKNAPLGEQESAPFLKFAYREGLMDYHMQIKCLEQCKDRLKQCKDKREEEKEKQGKLMVCLGGMGGLFLTIILL